MPRPIPRTVAKAMAMKLIRRLSSNPFRMKGIQLASVTRTDQIGVPDLSKTTISHAIIATSRSGPGLNGL